MAHIRPWVITIISKSTNLLAFYYLGWQFFGYLGISVFPIRHHISYLMSNSFAGKFSGCDLGFIHHVALLNWSNYGFDFQMENGQCKGNTSRSCTHASLTNRLKSRQRMAKYIHASLMLLRMKVIIWVRSFLLLLSFS